MRSMITNLSTKIFILAITSLFLAVNIPLTNSNSQTILDNKANESLITQISMTEEVIATFIENTIVSIQPSTQTVKKGEEFTVGIYVEPSELIIGVGFDIYFDPMLIQANSVRVGNLFDWSPTPGHPPGFYPGIIDNINGSIIGIMGVPILIDPTEEPGYFCNITFIAQQELGTSSLDIQNVMIMDIYFNPLPSTVIDGEVIVGGNTPEISDIVLIASEPLDTDFPFGWENVSCQVIDVIGIGEVKLIVTWPDDAVVEYPMINLIGTDIYYVNTTFTDAGCYQYYVWADDIYDNENTSSLMQFELPPNWDVDMDGRIHFMDLVKSVLIYGECGPPGWVREDVDNDGCILFMDLVKIVLYYNECWERC